MADLVRNFDQDPVENRKLIRDLLEADADTFLADALRILKSQPESRGSQYVVTLFVAYDLLVRALADLSLTKEQAVTLAHGAMRIDTLTDVTLAKYLAESAVQDDSPIQANNAARLMEILAEVSDGTRTLPSLMRMLRHPNPYIRSKAVKMIGRGSRSVKWVQKRLTESDPRIRANAIEALWGVDTEEARLLLHSATRDGNNRVAGNAMLALYQLGDCTVIPELLRLADHDSPLFRTTAAWVMGQTGDPRFTEALAKLLREPNAAVRTRALAALGSIKAAVTQSRASGELLVSGLAADGESHRAGRKLQVAVVGTDGREPSLLATQFLLTEGTRQVTAYKVTERPMAEAASLAFLFPRVMVPGTPSWAAGALSWRAWKRPSDLWAGVPYLAADDGPGEAFDEPLRFGVGPDGLECAMQTPSKRTECTDLWRSIWRCTRLDQGPQRGRRQVIVFADEPIRAIAGRGLISSVIASRAVVQAIATGPNPHLEDFCRAVRGTFRVAEDEEQIRELVRMAYLNLLARYDITYQPVCADAPEVKLRIHGQAGWGEAVIEVAIPSIR